MEKFSVSKMIGSAPGYVGYEEGGQLTEKIKRKPYSVILFDEIEKAHPDIFNILLQVLEDGHLTDAKGKKINFKNTIIIMTSNIASNEIMNYGKKGVFGFEEKNNRGKKQSKMEDLKEIIMRELKTYFKPEFLNRIDEIVTFKPLTREEVRQIVDIQLGQVKKRLEIKKIKTEFTDGLREYLLLKGFDEELGARPLKRAIQTIVLDPLAMKILNNEIKDGDEIIVGVKDEIIEIKNAV
jgi:ATP-dependent Clp protease ATP-binding subunit ClpC